MNSRMTTCTALGGEKDITGRIPEAYKDVSLVVDVVQRAGLARKVAKIHPMAWWVKG